MKKYFSIFLAMIFVISAATPALADEAACATAEQGNVMLIDGAFVQDNSSNDAITYSGLTVQTSDDLNCTMEFVLQVDDNSYSIGVSGELEEYTLSSETVIHHGCLRGSTSIDDVSYNVTVGLTEEVESGSINAGVVLMPVGDGWSNNVIIFSMGDYVVSPALTSIIAGNDVTNISVPIHTQTQQEISNALGVSVRVLGSEERSVSVRTYLNTNQSQHYIYEHFSYTGSGGGVSYSLSEIQVGARESSTILNLEGPHFPTGSDVSKTDVDPNDFLNIVWAVICDAISRYLPASTLTALISELSGRSSAPNEVGQYANNNWITLRGSGIYDQIWDCGLACTFATGPTASMSTGMALVTGYGNATFRVVQNVPLSGAVSFYLDATEVTGSVTVRVG